MDPLIQVLDTASGLRSRATRARDERGLTAIGGLPAGPMRISAEVEGHPWQVLFRRYSGNPACRAFVGGDEIEPGSDAHLQRDLEAVIACHVARSREVFYVKGMGEIDVAWYAGRKLQLVDVKWSTQLRPEEMKEIRRRGRGVVAARVRQEGEIDGVRVPPAAVVLLRLGSDS